MKIEFTKLPTTDGIIKVSLDGGQSFTDYNIADIHEDGISLEDNQNYEKIQIRGPANILKNLDIVSGVKIEGAESGSTNEPSFIIDTDTYGFTFPDCVTGIIIPNGITLIHDCGLSEFPNLKTISLPESVTAIGYKAFYECSNLTNVTIPESVISIGMQAFGYCQNLTSITIPDSVTLIGAQVFCSCSMLKTINYTGTEEQWNAIKKPSSWNTNCPSDVVINYKS